MNARVPRSLLILPLMFSAAACGGRSGRAIVETPPSVDVQVGRAAVQPVARAFEAGGVIRAQTTAQLTSRIVAEVREVRVQPGDRVTRGQTVVLLDDRDLAARRAQAQASVTAAQSGRASAEADGESAEARLILARASHQRIEQLRGKNSATPQELDQATAELVMAEAAVRAARARLAQASASVTAGEAEGRAAEIAASFSTISAPFNGSVTSTLIEAGNMASPGLPLMTVEATGAYRLEVQIDEGRARSLHVGDAVAVSVDGAEEGESITGRVVEIARAVDPAGHAFIVKVELPAAAEVRSGMFARARFEADERKALVVPASAIVRRGQLSLVFAVDGGGRARLRAITAGARSGVFVEVLAGVQAGELVILTPPASLADGAPVRTTGGRP